MAEKVTMVLKVDLQCSCCYKKVKKILCKFPQIGDQVYDEKANTVTITVVCCNPEKIRDKLYCKGCKVITSIEIKEPKPPVVPPTKPGTPQQNAQKPDQPNKPKSPGTCTWTCTCTYTWTCTCPGTCTGTCKGPTRTCCGGGPCYPGYGVPLLRQPCCDGYYVRSCDYYFIEDCPRGCSIM